MKARRLAWLLVVALSCELGADSTSASWATEPDVAKKRDSAAAAYFEGDYATAAGIWRPLAEQGDAQAQYFLGAQYEQGEGVLQGYAEAIKWYRKAAEQGLAGAQRSLGAAYANGEGVTQDYTEAIKWYRKAAEQGLAGAQTLLGLAYTKGEGVPQDYVQAHAWFNLAAALGFEIAGGQRDQVAAEMTPEQIAEAQRLARDWKPKKQ